MPSTMKLTLKTGGAGGASSSQEAPKEVLELDVENRVLKAFGKEYAVTVKDTLRTALINGTYDPLAELMKSSDKIAQLDKCLPPKSF